MKRVKVLDKEFTLSIPSAQIQEAVEKLAKRIEKDMAGKDPILLVILNGSFLFASDLYRKIDIDCQISFLKLASYQGSGSTGQVKQLIGLNENLQNKSVIIVEDIVDTGITLDNIIRQIKSHDPAEIKVATMLFKPDSYLMNYPIDYVGLVIPNDFVVGYGLDYNGYGRNLDDIYQLIESKKTEKLNVVLFGPPGAGKGTQALSLLREYELIHISTGDILRMEIADETALGIEAKKSIEKGELVPDNIVIGMISRILDKNVDANGFIFDGFPRTKIQAIELDKLLKHKGWEINVMITLDVTDSEVVRRILIRGKDSGRPDDQSINVIENRLKVYHEITASVVEHYKAQKKYRAVEGTGNIDDVFSSLCHIIDEY